jgi:hypothetical protein
MNSDRRPPRRSSTERDLLILEHVARYRMTTLEAIQRVVLRGLSRNAVNKITNRLCSRGLLRKYTLLYPENYFVLSELSVRNFGLGIQRSTPLGPQSLPQEFAMLAFATLGHQQHLRLNALEVRKRCPWLPLSLSAAPYCMDPSGILELVRVDLGGPADHVARKCAADVNERCRIPEFPAAVAAGQFRLVVITSTASKVDAIRRAFQHHSWPSGLLVHFTVVSQLLSLSSGENHA